MVTASPIRSTRDRIADIQKEISGVTSLYGITAWEKNFLTELADYDRGSINQMRCLARIEEKVFGRVRELAA